MMKRSLLCFVLAALLAMPAVAAAEVHGVYIAPKFLLGSQNSGALSRTGTSMGDGVPGAPAAGQGFQQYSQAVFGGALAVGYNFAPKFSIPLRTEIEFAMRSNTNDKRDKSGSWVDGNSITHASNWEAKQTTSISTLFLNAYFDFDTGTPFTPYIGGGLGMAFRNTQLKVNESYTGPDSWNESASKSQHSTTFAWNLGAGVSYAFTENVAADLGYRFVHTGHSETKLRLNSGERMKVGSSPHIHEFYLGARFTF